MKMRSNRFLGMVLALGSAAGLACASGGGSSQAPTQSAAPAQKAAPAKQQAKQETQPPAAPAPSDMPAGYSVPRAGSKLSKVTAGMNDTQVRAVMGEPTNANAYMTGKAFIPYYYGPDTSRTDWMYTGQGRVVFSRNRYSGGLKVIKVMANPNEP
jgi:hypothetical protein